MEDKNATIRSMLTNGITEDDFIENFEDIMSFVGFRFFEPADPEKGQLARLTRMWMPSCLEKIYRMNTTKNSWADYERLSDKLRTFLKLKQEEI
jgi:hypothetical protein